MNRLSRPGHPILTVLASALLILAILVPARLLLGQNPHHQFPLLQAPGPLPPPVKPLILSVLGLVLEKKEKKALLTVKHLPLKAVGWPGQVRDFPVADRKLFQKVKRGDKIRFDLRLEGQKYTIVHIENFKSPVFNRKLPQKRRS
ncbi:MAG: copper-binding protein [Deltaproteobacteria bacterium]|jgi:hypothetical protein|nr:copper-binding protein [Deltaproteobacteria bacterium]